MSWHTDKKVGQTATLPNGTQVKVLWVRGGKVRLQYIGPAPAGQATERRDRP